jgi:hypothetical protein
MKSRLLSDAVVGYEKYVKNSTKPVFINKYVRVNVKVDPYGYYCVVIRCSCSEGSFFFILDRSSIVHDLLIHVGTPKRGSIHLLRITHTAMITMNKINSSMVTNSGPPDFNLVV